MRFLLFLLAGLLFYAKLPAQQSSFPLLYSHGKLPYSFISTPEKRAAERVAKLRTSGNVVGQGELNFIYATEYVFSDFINSGFVTTGDSVSRYAGRILDRLLRDDADLRAQLHVYLLRSTEARIYTFGTGSMLLSTGLVARVENEAQLAYLLAREVIHYRERHSEAEFRRQSNLLGDSLEYRSALFLLPAETEALADRKALKLLADVGYASSESVLALELLATGNQCFGNVPFSISFFEHDDYVFPENYQLNRINDVPLDSAEQLIWPDITARCANQRKAVSELVTAAGLQFIESPETFAALRQLTREEVVRLYAVQQQFEFAIYSAYALIKSDSSNATAKRVIAYSLFALANYISYTRENADPEIFIISVERVYTSKAETTSESFHLSNWETIAGKVQEASFFLNKLTNVELTVLALDWCWKVHEQTPGETVALHQSRQLMKLLKAEYEQPLDSFQLHPFQPVFVPIAANATNKPTTAEQPEDLPLSRGIAPESITTSNSLQAWDTFKTKTEVNQDEKLKAYIRDQAETIPDSSFINTHKSVLVEWRGPKKDSSICICKYCYYRYAFARYQNVPYFKLEFNNASRNFNTELNSWAFAIRGREINKNSDSGLGCPSVILNSINANEYLIDPISRDLIFDRAASEKLRIKQQKALVAGLDYSNIKTNLTSPASLTVSDAVAYTNWCLLQTWVHDHNNFLADELYLPANAYYGLCDTIQSRYQSPYLLSSFLRYQYVIGAMSNERGSRIITIVYDITTGKPVLYWSDDSLVRHSSHMLSTYYKKVFLKITEPRKAK